MTREIWRGIEGFPKYEVSSKGRVRSWNTKNKHDRKTLAKKARILKQTLRTSGSTHYYAVSITNESGRKTALVHQLVTEAFSGPRPQGMVCRHINGDSLDNRADNLRWGTPAENTADRYLHGTANFTGGKVAPVLTDEEAFSIYVRGMDGERYSDIAKDFPNVCPETVRLVVVGKARAKVVRAMLMSEAS